MSKRIIISPLKYVQGAGEIKNLADYFKPLSRKKPYIISGNSALKKYKDDITASLVKENIPYELTGFGGECSRVEIDRQREAMKAAGADAVIGIGGGKVIDTAKAVAYYENAPVIIVPTIASTDAPCSALTVLYTEDGAFDAYLPLPSNPNCVLVDTSIVAEAPSRLLVAGMGDALATYFEARAAKASQKTAMAGGLTSLSAMALAKLSYETLLADGLKAKLAVDAGATTQAVENIIEANTFLSGIGFESGGLGAAHAIHNGLTVLPETHDVYHGEKVAFGTLTQLVLENASLEEIQIIVDFCKSVGLATTLAQLGIKDATKEKLMKVAKASCAEGETIYNMPFEITVEMVYGAIVTADKLGV